MIIRTLEQLTQPDELVLRFTPLGLSMGGLLRAEDAAEFQQKMISRADLVTAVPDSIRSSFERLRSLHTYGLFCYELYTAADDLASLVLEQALRERFVAYYDGVIPLVNRDGLEDLLRASSFDAVYKALNGRGHYARGGWRLQLRVEPGSLEFKGRLPELLDWARKEGLLRGQRSRRLEPVLVRMRNRAAHPSGYGLVTPVDSARSVLSLGEIINQLWGSPTPGGRLYPGPIMRDVLAVGWDPSGAKQVKMRAELLEGTDAEKDWTYLLVRAVEIDEDVWEFDAHYEVTSFPAEFLWGPGSWQEAVAWLKRERPSPDEVEYLDRLFAIRVHDGRPDLPRRPEVAAGVSGETRRGTWHLIRADHPNDAFLHVRGPGGIPNPSCAADGFCGSCGVETLTVGPWHDVMDHLGHLQPAIPPEARAPGRWTS